MCQIPFSPWTETELDRLRRLKRECEEREEAARLRRWLQERGALPWPCWPPPQPFQPPLPIPAWPVHPPANPPSVDRVVERIRQAGERAR